MVPTGNDAAAEGDARRNLSPQRRCASHALMRHRFLLECRRGKRGSGQPLARPTRGDIEALSTAYRCRVPRRKARSRRPREFHSRRVVREPLRLALYPAGGSGPGHTARPVFVPPAPQAPHPSPHGRTVRTNGGSVSELRRAGINGGWDEVSDKPSRTLAIDQSLRTTEATCCLIVTNRGLRIRRSSRVDRGSLGGCDHRSVGAGSAYG